MGRKNNRRKYVYSGFEKYLQTAKSPAPKRGEVWFADLGRHPNSSVQGGCRPVIILSNNIGNEHADTVNIVPMTRHLKKPELPCHTEITPDHITDKRQYLGTSMVLAEQVTTISKYALRSYVGKIADSGVLSRIEQSVAAQLGIKLKEKNLCQSIS
ncbi:MAG: type II toxin-antitoxin system PemK/MazF family toxin [Alistipes sp.]|nr:type II toxin-antitoxin system PemK/MazF family toxin [Alistipes sp.]